jgi:hypothetical protein
MFDIEVFVDDSGTHEHSPIAIAACYIADSSQWKEFVRNWDEARKDEGFDFFHMKDFMALPDYGRKPFCDWSPEKKNRVYRRLVSIIHTRVRYGIGFGVQPEAFNKHISPRMREECTSDAYTFAVQSLLGILQEWYAKHGNGKAIQYIFENRKGMGKVKQLWEVLGEYPEQAKKMGASPLASDGMSFQSPKCFKPLQAADILAWNFNAHLRDVILKGLPDDDRHTKPYFQMLRWNPLTGRNHPLRIGYLTSTQTQEAFDKNREYEVREGVRSYMLPKRMLKELGIRNPVPRT